MEMAMATPLVMGGYMTTLAGTSQKSRDGPATSPAPPTVVLTPLAQSIWARRLDSTFSPIISCTQRTGGPWNVCGRMKNRSGAQTIVFPSGTTPTLFVATYAPVLSDRSRRPDAAPTPPRCGDGLAARPAHGRRRAPSTLMTMVSAVVSERHALRRCALVQSSRSQGWKTKRWIIVVVQKCRDGTP